MTKSWETTSTYKPHHEGPTGSRQALHDFEETPRRLEQWVRLIDITCLRGSRSTALYHSRPAWQQPRMTTPNNATILAKLPVVAGIDQQSCSLRLEQQAIKSACAALQCSSTYRSVGKDRTPAHCKSRQKTAVGLPFVCIGLPASIFTARTHDKTCQTPRSFITTEVLAGLPLKLRQVLYLSWSSDSLLATMRDPLEISRSFGDMENLAHL